MDYNFGLISFPPFSRSVGMPMEEAMARKPGWTHSRTADLEDLVYAAAATLRAVAARMTDSPDLAVRVEEEAMELLTYALELQTYATPDHTFHRHAESRSSAWSPNGSSLDAVLAEAETRPGGLISVANHAVGAVGAAFDHALEQSTYPIMEAVLEGHRHGLHEIRGRLSRVGVGQTAPGR